MFHSYKQMMILEENTTQPPLWIIGQKRRVLLRNRRQKYLLTVYNKKHIVFKVLTKSYNEICPGII